MSDQQYRWRIAHLSANDEKTSADFVARFEQAYKANNEPDGMAMFSHNTAKGVQIALSITPESVPYCPFSDGWDESATRPRLGYIGFVAGNTRLRL
jgi:hypothetical protein